MIADGTNLKDVFLWTLSGRDGVRRGEFYSWPYRPCSAVSGSAQHSLCEYSTNFGFVSPGIFFGAVNSVPHSLVPVSVGSTPQSESVVCSVSSSDKHSLCASLHASQHCAAFGHSNGYFAKIAFCVHVSVICFSLTLMA